jgi:hypothetical protein
MPTLRFFVRQTPEPTESAGLRLDDDNTPLSSTLTNEPALIDDNTTTPVAASWEQDDSYGFDMASPVAIDGIEVWNYVDSTSTLYTWQSGAHNKTGIYSSNDNSTWTLIKNVIRPPVFTAGPNTFNFRCMFDVPVTARYFKITNEGGVVDNLQTSEEVDLEITEIAHRMVPVTPVVEWSATEQHPDYGGAFTNPVVAIKQLNTVANQVIATQGYSTGKRYFEIEIFSSTFAITNSSIGIRQNETDSGSDYSSYVGSSGRGGGYMAQGRFYRNGSLLVNEAQLTYAYVGSFTIGVAADLDNGYIWFSRDGSIVNKTGDNGNPTTGVDPAISGMTTGVTYYPALSLYYSSASAPPNYIAARLNAMESNILHLPSGYTPWDETI